MDLLLTLWSSWQISFHAWVDLDMALCMDSLPGGEVDVEKIATRAIEVRAKGLIPVLDSLHMHRFQSLIDYP